MRVLVDVSEIPDEPVGTGVYVLNLVRTLAAGAEVDLELLARRGDRARWREVARRARVHTTVPTSGPARWLWSRFRAARAAQLLGVDVWHGPQEHLPRHLGGLRRVVTVHDVSIFEYPELHEPEVAQRRRGEIRQAVADAHVVVAVSDDTALRVQRVLRPEAEVVVAPHGVDRSRYRPSNDPDTVEADRVALELLDVKPPFLAFVGTLEPRKNVPGLIEAFSRLAASRPDLQLVVAGRRGWRAEEVEDAVVASPYRDRIRVLGFAAPEVLPPLYRQAAAVVHPSRGEGFGLPALEALACGAPLITTAGSPMEEVAGTAAVLVPSEDIELLTRAIERVLDDDKLVQRLRDEGPRVAGRFSWGLCARAHIEAYANAVGSPA